MWYKRAEADRVNIEVPESLKAILEALMTQGMKPLIVGGAVRDAIMGYEPKDIDVEVYGAPYGRLESALKSIPGAFVDSVGKSFGIVKFRTQEGEEYDFSVPRRESKAGAGHRGFKVEFDPTITPKEAAARRDFTMNALAFDPFTHKVIDFYGGVEDIKNRVLRHTSPAFAEDPLRVLRGMQFASRFGMDLAPETAELSRQIMDQYPTLSKERVEGEWKKLVEKGRYPGKAIKYLQDTGWIDHYPEIKDLIGVPQDLTWHPEGEVNLHTAHVMDAAAQIADRQGLKGDQRAVLIYAALAHDFAKAHLTEQRMKDGQLRWTAHGHEQAGGPLAKQFLQGIGVKKDVIDKVVPLVENHLAHIQFNESTPLHVLKRLSDRLWPATIGELALLIEADHSGRPPLPAEFPQQARTMLDRATEIGVHEGRPEQLLLGRDLQQLGMAPGPVYGDILKAAYMAQLDGRLHGREDALEWLKKAVRPYIAIIRGNHPFFTEYGVQGPELGRLLNEVYDAQLSGEVKTPEEAIEFLRSKVPQAQTTKQDI